MLDTFRTQVYFAWHSEHRTAVLLVFSLLMLMIVAGSLLWNTMSESRLEQELRCLALNIYHEARGEPPAGQVAVGLVTLNRVRSPDYPDSVCAVVYQRAWNPRDNRHVSAFSWTTQRVDLMPSAPAWLSSENIARTLLKARKPYEAYSDQEDGVPGSPVRDALYYHADHITPYWAQSKKRLAKVGRHVFYK